MESHITFSIVMIDGNFREHFHAIDFFCQQNFPKSDYEILWVEYYSKVNPELQAKINACTNARLITLNRTGQYHSSYCFNEGIKQAQGEIIIIPDADVVPEPHFLQTVKEEHEQNDKLVMYVHRFNQKQEDYRPDWDIDYLKSTTNITNPANYGSCLIVRKKWLLEINGYEQHVSFATDFHGNGYNIHSRLKTLGLHVMWHPSLKLYHPWHQLTGGGRPAYIIHHAVSDYMLRRQMYKAFEGIDPDQNIEVPADLSQLITSLEQKHYNKSIKQKIKQKLRNIIS